MCARGGVIVSVFFYGESDIFALIVNQVSQCYLCIIVWLINRLTFEQHRHIFAQFRKALPLAAASPTNDKLTNLSGGNL